MTNQPLRLTQAQLVWLNTHLQNQFKESYEKSLLLAGDGSTRSFFRMWTKNNSAILVFDPEWTQTQDYTPHCHYLKSLGLRVPTFFSEEPKLGLLLMEDLGDTLLQEVVLKGGSHVEGLLLKVAEVLANLHGKSFPVPKTLPVCSRSFDTKKLMEEFRFTETHLVRGVLKLPEWTSETVSVLTAFSNELEKITPQVFCHRDYHTRNILVFHEELYLIDFQDARMGPVHYDLCSFLYDPYVPISPEKREKVKKHYRKTLTQYPLYQNIDWHHFEAQLDAFAFQRLIKAAGSFASFFTRFGKRTHLSYIVPALQTALTLEAAKKNTEALPLKAWLERFERAKIS